MMPDSFWERYKLYRDVGWGIWRSLYWSTGFGVDGEGNVQ